MNPTEIVKSIDKLSDILIALTEIKEHVPKTIDQRMVTCELASPILSNYASALVAIDLIHELDLIYELSANTGLQEIFHEAGFTKGVIREFQNRCKVVNDELGKEVDRSKEEDKID